jgi:D-arabinose 1-dehydrogenase-like Zn-dependent alcohol dehydrogenase
MQTQFEEAKTKTESLQVNSAPYFNPNELLKLKRIPKPQPGPNDVLLRVKAAGICHTDPHIMAGMMPTRRPPVALGHEIAGQVKETGSNVTRFKRGNRTVVYFISHCGNCKYCLEGRGVQCENLFNRPFCGASHDGGCAEMHS